jgi:hypothetical protein
VTTSKEKWKKQRDTHYQKMLDFLASAKCVDCKEGDVRCLNFDHVLEKKANISDLVHSNASWKKISAEIDKTEVRCYNCHNKKTEERANSKRHQYWSLSQSL